MSSYNEDSSEEYDEMLDFMVYMDTLGEKQNSKKSSGGGCLTSLVLILAPVVGVAVLIGNMFS